MSKYFFFVEAYHFVWSFLHWDMVFLYMRSDTFFTLPQWLWGVEIHFDQMMYDWLYSSHRCLFWRCLHWGITHSSVMDFMRWQLMPDTYFLEIILHLELTHIERMHSYWGIATLLILTLRLDLLLMDYRVVDTLSLVFSTYLVWFKYPLTFVTYSIFCLWHCLIQSLIDISPIYLIIEHDLIPFSWSRKDADQSWVFWSSFHMPLEIWFNIFHDGMTY